MTIRFLSTFSGIGGFDKGCEDAGWECVGQIEIDDFCQAVLAHHWPKVWKGKDIRDVTGEIVRENCGRVDAVIGGPPCQPGSVAGQRRGAADERWMWPEFLRLVFEINPLLVLAENPCGTLSIQIGKRKFADWLADRFQAAGYELQVFELAAEDVGAPHRRERAWFVAYRTGDGRREGGG